MGADAPPGIEQRIAAARAHLARGDLQGAVGLLEAARTVTSDPRLTVELADTWRVGGQPQRALELLSAFDAADPPLAAALHVKGLAQRDLGALAEAETSMRRSVDAGAGAGALLDLLRMQERLEDFESVAASVAARAGNVESQLNVGLARFWRGDLDGALRIFRDLQPRWPEQAARLRVMEADVLMARHEPRPARELLSSLLGTPGLEPRMAAAVREMYADCGLMEQLLPLGGPAPGDVPAPEPWFDTAPPSLTALAGSGAESTVIVLYHVDLDGAHPMSANRAALPVDYGPILRSVVSAAQQWIAGVRVVLLTDQHSRMPGDLGNTSVVRLPVRRDHIVYERVRAMYAWVCGPLFRQRTLFLDTDVVVNTDIGKLFDGTFDIAVTLRPNEALMPVNEGVVMVAPENALDVRRFFGRWLGWFERLALHPAVRQRYPRDIRCWRGGQLSLAAATGWPEWHAQGMRNVAGARVRMSSVAELNFPFPSPKQATTSCAFRLAERRHLVHFKGARQKLVLPSFVAWRLQGTGA